MKTQAATKAYRVRSSLNHPIIDADGHMIEFAPPVEDYVREIAGSKCVVVFGEFHRRFHGEEDQRRLFTRQVGPAWWNYPNKNTYDRATAALPKLLHQRMEELGMDFSVLFPSMSIVQVQRAGSPKQNSNVDPEMRRIRARAVNAYRSDICREFSDRLAPAAEIPMETPEAAIEDLEYAAKKLGMKAISIESTLRTIPEYEQKYPGIRAGAIRSDTKGAWLDTYGIDSQYDYDPFWAKCLELKIAVMSHGSGRGFTGRSSPTNYMYNHIGHFADAGEALCKSLFFGGVPRRFPKLKFAFLEGGVGWAFRMYCDTIGHWEKRGKHGIKNYNPANLDRSLYQELHARFGGPQVQKRLDQVLRVGGGLAVEPVPDDELLDEFRLAKIERKQDIKDVFDRNFFFGCEADDHCNALAFQTKLAPMGTRLNAMFSSDIGHWDVPEMGDVVPEAYELVEKGLLTEADFRKFTFSHAVTFFAGVDPDFFKGTAVEQAVEKELQSLGR